MPPTRTATVTETSVSGTHRFKYFKRPIMPKVSVVPPQVLLAPTNNNEGQNNPMEPPAPKAEQATKDAEIQTMYRESEAQTVPYTPEFVVAPGQHPEVLLLQSLTYENGLPLGTKEITMIEYARSKQEMEANLPPFTDEASLNLRKKLMEQQEMREFRLREAEMDNTRHEKVQKMAMALAEREESNDFMTSQRLESIKLLKLEEREKLLQKIRHKRIKALRRLAHQRNVSDPVLSDGNKKDIIDNYFDKGSSVYAPIKREGKEIALKNDKNDVSSRTMPLDNLSNISNLEYTLPRSLLVDRDNQFNPTALLSKTMPVGAGHRAAGKTSKVNTGSNPVISKTISAAEPRLSSAAARTLRMTKRDVEEMHQILAQKKRVQAMQQHLQNQQAAKEAREGKSANKRGTAMNALLASITNPSPGKKHQKGQRPATPDFTRDREIRAPEIELPEGVTMENLTVEQQIAIQEQMEQNARISPFANDHEFQLAVILLQRLIRGRAVQNIMFEGKYRRRELIQELKYADEIDAQYRDATEQELEDELKVVREDRLRESSYDTVAGTASSQLFHVLGTDKTRVDMMAYLQEQALAAIHERRVRECIEAGRRQREGLDSNTISNRIDV